MTISEPSFAERFAERLVVQRLAQCRVEAIEEGGRRAGRRGERQPGVEREAVGHLFDQRRHLGHHRGALGAGDGQSAQLALLRRTESGRHGREGDLDLLAEQAQHDVGRALVGDMDVVDAGGEAERLGRQVGEAADAARTVVQLAGIGLGERDELGDRLGRRRRRHHHQRRDARQHGDRHEVLLGVVVELPVEELVLHVAAGQHQQRVAVRCRARRRLGADIAGGARLVLDDELLAEPLGQPLRRLPRRHIRRAAGDERHDDAHRLVGVLGLRRPACEQRQQRREQDKRTVHWKRFSSACHFSFSNRLQSWP